nr:MAG TPA: hypothetical protein [Caudoviricetes sp.]
MYLFKFLNISPSFLLVAGKGFEPLTFSLGD